MGTWYDSLSVRGAAHDDVKAKLAGWAMLRGLSLDPCPLFSCRDEDMGFYLVSNADWTIVLPSRDGEMPRLVRTLAPLGRPMLRLTCASSDAWGYILIDDGRPVAEFFDAGPYEWSGELSDEPATDLREGDPAALCRVLGLADVAQQIRRIQRSRPLMREESARRFCELLGLAPAASRHSYMESAEDMPGASWRTEHLVFAHEDDASTFDLHAATAWPIQSEREAEEERQRLEERRAAGEARHASRRPGLPMRLLRRAVGSLLWLGFGARAWLSRDEATAAVPPEMAPCCRADGEWLVNDRHRARVKLPAGWTPRPAFDVEAVIEAGNGAASFSIRACRFDELQAMDRRPALSDELLVVSGRKARRRVVVMPERGASPADDPPVHAPLAAVQGPRAIYLISCAGLGDAEARRLVFDALESFEVD